MILYLLMRGIVQTIWYFKKEPPPTPPKGGEEPAGLKLF